jgi:N-acetyl-alpha-D-glucosaminyl L-malate synthase BshA
MSRPLSIGIICYPTSGGSGIVATDLAIGLARAGERVTVVSYAQPLRLKGYQENLDFCEVQTEHYPVFHHPPYTLSLAATLCMVARERNLDVIHAHYAVPHATAGYLARQILQPRPLRLVTTLHGTDITLVGTRPSFYETTRFSILQSDAVTTVSRWLEAETRRALDVEIPIHVIPNFVDTETFRPRSGPRQGILAGGEPVLMHASNFRKVKNVPTVVEVFHRVRQRVPCRLVLVGDGPERAKVVERVRALGRERDVLFLGLQDAIEEILPQADVLLLPSEHESFGVVALEAMACGVPVVATNRGGIREVVADGVTGYLRDPRDVEGMVEATLRILEDPGARQRMGAAGRERAETHFRLETMVERYRELYRTLLDT